MPDTTADPCRPAADARRERPARPARTTARARRQGPLTVVAILGALALLVTAGSPSIITIRQGDTLWDLARTHGTSVQALRELNGLGGNGVIYAGRMLRISGGSASASSNSSPARSTGQGTYVVRPGDTLSHLAVRFSTSTRAIQQANRLPSNTIRIGQHLSIPGASSTRAAGSPASVPSTGALQDVANNRAVLAARSHPSKSQVRRMVADTARSHGVPSSLAVAVAYHESGFQQRVVSGANAIGVMQVLPSTGRVLSTQNGRTLDLLDTQDNITAGVLLLRQLLRSTGSTDKSLAGYYQGLGSISRKGLLPQTHAYIKQINTLQKRFGS